ncbi:MAG: NAD+ synthase (glutamine-hydrolyzing) [Bacteroidia bacterium]|jgi:NAD+ synthase (glutamine-hydrolysing)
MKIVLSQLNFTIGDLDGNVQKMAEHITQAKSDDVDLVVFSELSICGYIPKDMLNYKSFVERCYQTLNHLITYTKGIAILVGMPTRSNLDKGKALYNSAIFIADGEILSTTHKTLLPTYDVFDEYRYFEPNKQFELVHYKGVKIAVTICEDLWNLNEPKLYGTTPMDELVKLNPDLMINISGSPYSYNHVEERKNRMIQNAKTYKLPLVYVNQIGAHSDILFDGGSMFINQTGEIAEELGYFVEDYRCIDWSKDAIYPDNSLDYKDEDIELIHDALVMGIKDYFGKMGFKKALLGSSGGIDSAVINALAVEALGAENVLAVLLPSKYSSEGSVVDAEALSNNLGCPYETISIKDLVDVVESTLAPQFKGHDADVTEENIQARSRGLLLMALSNKFGSMVLNTSNKSETAVGYATLYGDMCGGLSAIGDLYKIQVYEMARYINRNKEIIPNEIINKAPSAELRFDQKDSDSLPPYELLDKVLMLYIEQQKGWQEIVALGYDAHTVRRVIKLVDRNEYKRFQAAPILRISNLAFGIGRQMPLVARFYN